MFLWVSNFEYFVFWQFGVCYRKMASSERGRAARSESVSSLVSQRLVVSPPPLNTLSLWIRQSITRSPSLGMGFRVLRLLSSDEAVWLLVFLKNKHGTWWRTVTTDQQCGNSDCTIIAFNCRWKDSKCWTKSSSMIRVIYWTVFAKKATLHTSTYHRKTNCSRSSKGERANAKITILSCWT